MEAVRAVEIIADTMYPAFRQGDIAFCDCREAVAGDDVAIEMISGAVCVRRLVKRTAGALIVEQFNPAKCVSFASASIKAVRRLIPARELYN
jgi:phage repressor protein C with HTH and peptisase S24 domain